MISPFTLHQPDSLEAACSLLRQHGEEAKILAGGSELVLLLKMGLARPGHLIDIKGIPDLDRIHFDSSTQLLRIGALVTHRALELAAAVREHFPLFAQMERQLASVRVRNVGSLGGNLSFAEPHADPGMLLLAYRARIKARSASGERTIDLSDFFADYYKTALEENEILTGIELPKPGENFSGTYCRFCPGERPSAAVALLMEWKDGGCENVRLVMGCVGPRPIRAEEVEESLSKKSAEEILAKTEETATKAALLCDPLDDFWGSADYKRQIVKTLVLRALSRLCEERISSQEKSL